MTRRRSARCIKCYDEMWLRYGKVINYSGELAVYDMKGRWEHVRVERGPRGGFKAVCKNCGHTWRISYKTAHASGYGSQHE